MVLKQISTKFHTCQQITKQGKVNVQRKAKGKKRLWYSDFSRQICILVYIYAFFLFSVTTDIQYFVNKFCEAPMSINQVLKF